MAEDRKDRLPLPEALSLRGRRALVTGAAMGIGRAAARCLAELGADLTLVDVAPLDEVRADVEQAGRSAEVLQGDLTDEAFLQRIISRGPFFSFANVAGAFRAPKGFSPKEAFDFVMHVNVRAPLILANAFIEKANAQDGGYMVFVGSTAGRSGMGRIGEPVEYATYASSKGGIHTLVRVLSYRAAKKNILVNGVAPGVVRTPMMYATAPHFETAKGVSSLGRPAEPAELGWPIALLCTPMACFMSGAIVDINGGAFVG